MMLYSFKKIPHRVSELLCACYLYTEICKRALFGKNVGGVKVLVLSILSDHALHLYQVLSKYLIGLQSYGPEQKGRR